MFFFLSNFPLIYRFSYFMDYMYTTPIFKFTYARARKMLLFTPGFLFLHIFVFKMDLVKFSQISNSLI